MTNWKPISTAPKRENKVILVGWWLDNSPTFSQATARWQSGTPGFTFQGIPFPPEPGYWELAHSGAYAADGRIEPTHWQPLPASPKRRKGVK